MPRMTDLSRRDFGRLTLAGVPRRERTEVGPSRAPIVIVDGALGAAPLELDTVAAVPPSRRANAIEALNDLGSAAGEVPDPLWRLGWA